MTELGIVVLFLSDWLFPVFVGLTAASAIVHAIVEWRGGLHRYLAETVAWPGLATPAAGAVLFGLAVSLHLLPLLAVSLLEASWTPAGAAWVAGSRLADLLGTHALPTMLTGRRSPGLETALLDLGIVVVWSGIAGPEWYLGMAGALSFIALWPAVVGAKALLTREGSDVSR